MSNTSMFWRKKVRFFLYSKLNYWYLFPSNYFQGIEGLSPLGKPWIWAEITPLPFCYKKIVNWDSVTPAHATTRVSRVLLTTTPSSQQSTVNCRSFQDGGFRNETEEKFKEFYLFCLVKRKVLSLRVITMKTSGFILAFALMWRYFVRRTNGGKSS